MLLINAAELNATARRVFAAAGSAEAEAEIVAGPRTHPLRVAAMVGVVAPVPSELGEP